VKIKLKGRHFDITEMIKAESQAMRNTLTEHDAFKNGRIARNDVYTSRVMMASRPEVCIEHIREHNTAVVLG
jgi:hypothetical protein